ERGSTSIQCSLPRLPGVETGQDDHLRASGTAGANPGLDRDRLLQLEVDEHQVGRELVAVHQLQPGMRAQHQVEIGGVRVDPTAEAVKQHFVVVKKSQPYSPG